MSRSLADLIAASNAAMLTSVAVEVRSAAEVGSGEVGAAEVSAAEVGAAEVGSGEVGVSEV